MVWRGHRQHARTEETTNNSTDSNTTFGRTRHVFPEHGLRWQSSFSHGWNTDETRIKSNKTSFARSNAPISEV